MTLRKVTFALLCLYVASLTWDQAVTLPLIGGTSRLIGVLLGILAVLMIVSEGRIRKFGAVDWLVALFTASNALTLVWTIALDLSISRVFTYFQLFVIVVVVGRLCVRAEQVASLMAAYCVGGHLSMIDALARFVAGASQADHRYAAATLNPNEYGIALALGIPMAWYLFLTGGGYTRLSGALYVPIAALVIILTASRGAALAGLVGLLIVPTTMFLIRFRNWIAGIVLLTTASAAAAVMVPSSSWDRIVTTSEEINSGSVGGRGPIWVAGWTVFTDHAIAGVGAGAFETAVEPMIGRAASHNTILAILVEQGVFGFLLFVMLVGACVRIIARLPGLERQLWVLTGFTWLVGAMSTNAEYNKVTWLLFALVPAHAYVLRTCGRVNPLATFKPVSLPSSRTVAAVAAHGDVIGRRQELPGPSSRHR